jgi:hypothetical protein
MNSSSTSQMNSSPTSQMLQYTARIALSGVFDPLDPLDPGLALPDRLEALERWETAWREMDLREPTASIDAPVPARTGNAPLLEFSFGQYFVVIREGSGISAGYSFLDMHARSASHTNAAQWTTIEMNTPNVLVFAFASELDLAVAISCVRQPHRCFFLLPLSHPGPLLNPHCVGHRQM